MKEKDKNKEPVRGYGMPDQYSGNSLETPVKKPDLWKEALVCL